MPGSAMLDGLTPRQREIVSLIEQGRSNKEIASLLDIGVGTVKQHVAALFRRLNVTSRAQAVAALRGLAASEAPGQRQTGSSTLAQTQHNQEASALGAECRVISVAAIILEPAEGMAQALGTRRLVDRLESLVRFGRQAADSLGGQCYERAGQGIELRFGLIRARRDDAERAIRAARFVLERLMADDDAEPHPRGGIATGVSVVMAQGAQAARPLACTELAQAWRLAYHAPAGRLLACEATQRLTSDILGFEAFTAVGGLGRTAQVRGELPLHAPAMLPSPRQALLEDLQVMRKQSACILIEAAGGLGRTTLAAALAERIEATAGLALYIPAGRRALGPDATGLALALEIKLGLGFAEESRQREARLEAFLSGMEIDEPSIRQTLRGLISPTSPPAGLGELAVALAGLSKSRPLTLLIDDIEEASPALIDLLSRLAEEANPSTLGVICFGKDIPEALRERLPSPERMRMPPLLDEDMIALIASLDGDSHLDEGLVRAVVRQAQGRPGDGVELVMALLGRIKAKGDAAIPQGLPMPIRLYASLIAEMDQDADLREALRLAALLGRFFAPGLLARFWPRGQKALDEALARATEAKLLVHEGSGASIRYAFARPLLREAAVLSWLTADRSRLRARIERTRVRVGAVPLALVGEASRNHGTKAPVKEAD